MTWKNYAKTLEARIQASESFTELYDSFTGDTLRFKSPKVLVEYLKMKSKINSKISATLINMGDDVTPTSLGHTEVRLMRDCQLFRRELEGYIEQNDDIINMGY